MRGGILPRGAYFSSDISVSRRIFVLFAISYEVQFSFVNWQGGNVFPGADCQSRLWTEMPSSDLASLSSRICQKILFTYCKSNLFSCNMANRVCSPESKKNWFTLLRHILKFFCWLEIVYAVVMVYNHLLLLFIVRALKWDTTLLLCLLVEA